MNPFDLFLKIAPLYFLIAIGFMAGRKTRLDAGELAFVNFTFLAPLVYFEAISRLNFSLENILLPATCFALLSVIAAVLFVLTKLFSKDVQKPYWFASSAAGTNTGYFGIPVFLVLFGQSHLGLYMLYAFGATLFLFIVTQYCFIRSRYGFAGSFVKMARLPVLHAIIVGMICQVLHWHVPSVFDGFFTLLRGAFSVIGMMTLGLVLSRQGEGEKAFIFEAPLIAGSNLARFILFPLLSLGVILLDRQVFHVFSPMAQQIIMLVSLMPMGADAVSLAAQWEMQPRRVAALVLINSLLALAVIPFLLPILLAL